MVLKMSSLDGVIPIKRDVKCASNCGRESYKTADMLLVYVELQHLMKALVEPPPPPNHSPNYGQGQDFQAVQPTGGQAQRDDSTVHG
jgi:hypothetical protein